MEDKGDGLCYKSYTELQLSEETGDYHALSNTGTGIVAQGEKKVIFNLSALIQSSHRRMDFLPERLQ